MSRSRSRSDDAGRWGDDAHVGQHDSKDEKKNISYGGSRGRSRSPDRELDRMASGRGDPPSDRDNRELRDGTRSKSREKAKGRSRSRSRSRDRRRTGSARSRSPDGERKRELNRERRRSRSRDRDRNRDRGGGDRDRGGGRDRERDRDRERRDRDRRRSRSRERGRDPSRDRAGDRDRERDGEGAPRRRWRSPSPRAGGDAGWSNPPPPQPYSRDGAAGRPALPPPPPVAPQSAAPPPVGSIHRGTVHTVRPFGMFVALPGYRRHVLVHNTQVSDELRFTREDDEDAKVKAMEFYFPRGEQVWVKVTEVAADERNPGEPRVNGSLRAVDQASGADLDPQGLLTAQGGGGGGGRGGGAIESDEPPEVGSIHRATVKRIEAYGVFVALEGFRRHGLVHTSQVSNYLSFSKEDTDEQKKSELAGVVSPGEQVWVKVVEVTPDEARGGFKVGCSIKLASQADGEDLDPGGSRYRPREAAGRGAGGGAAIGAHAGEVGRGGKIDWGHLAADTKLYVDPRAAAQYALLEEERPQQQQRLPPPPAGIPGLGGGQAPGRGGHPPGGPMGRGRGSVLPAWMTQGGAGGAAPGPAAPGSLPGPPPLPPSDSRLELKSRDRPVDPSAMLLDLVGGGDGSGAGGRISSIEEALAILEAAGGRKGSKKEKKDKDKKRKRGKKERKEKSKRSKSGGKGRRRGGSSSGSGSSSDEDSGDERKRRR